MDFITGQGGGARAYSNPYAQINLLSGKGKTDRTKEPNRYSTMGSSRGFPLDALAKSGFPLLICITVESMTSPIVIT